MFTTNNTNAIFHSLICVVENNGICFTRCVSGMSLVFSHGFKKTKCYLFNRLLTTQTNQILNVCSNIVLSL